MQNEPQLEQAQSTISQIMDKPKEAWGESDLVSLVDMFVDLGLDQESFEASLEMNPLWNCVQTPPQR